MTSESDDSLQSISGQLNGKNLPYWSYVPRNFLKGRGYGNLYLEPLLSQ